MSLGHRTNARKTFYKASYDIERPDGRNYDSMLEASVARDLDILYRSKQLKEVKPQVVFKLYGKNGREICTHRVDFLVTCLDGTQKVVEAKGEEASDWRIKRKLFEDNYPHVEYIVATRDNMNYGKVIDVPKAVGPPSPNTYTADVEAVIQHFK